MWITVEQNKKSLRENKNGNQSKRHEKKPTEEIIEM